MTMAESAETTDARNMQVIELHMMDKRKYYPLALLSGSCIRTVLYPLSLVKTRLQIQNKKTLYNGTWDAFRKIVKLEGFTGLYRGYLVNSLLFLPQMMYVSAYEGVRQYLHDNSIDSTQIKSFIAGGCASMVSQTFVVPIDIVSQHMMLIGRRKAATLPAIPGKPASSHLNPLNIDLSSSSNARLNITWQVTKAIYRNYGVKGFYKGYCVSLLLYCPHSALWWLFYDRYCDVISAAVPQHIPRLAVQCLAAPFAGCTATFLTNPLDVSRTRLQVNGYGTLFSTLAELWKYERYRLFTKAVTARLFQSTIFSFFIILGYESVKKLSLLEEHKSSVKW